MSIQFNYFANNTDEEAIQSLMLDYLGVLCVLPKRAAREKMRPIKVESASDWGDRQSVETLIIFPIDYSPMLEAIEVSGGALWVNYRAFPCLEYQACRMDHDGVLHCGRMAYFYSGDDPLRNSVQRLFRSLRKRSRKIPGRASPWILENTASTVPMLGYYMNIVEPNPFFEESQV